MGSVTVIQRFGSDLRLGDSFHDPDKSREEPWHGAMEALRARVNR